MGSDGFLAAGEEWTKTCGPWFIYMNHVSAKIDDPRQAAHALYADALAQAEKGVQPISSSDRAATSNAARGRAIRRTAARIRSSRSGSPSSPPTL